MKYAFQETFTNQKALRSCFLAPFILFNAGGLVTTASVGKAKTVYQIICNFSNCKADNQKLLGDDIPFHLNKKNFIYKETIKFTINLFTGLWHMQK